MKERKKFEFIRKIGEILVNLNPKKNVLFTIVDLKLPKKGGEMKVYLSVFPEKEAKEIINFFNKVSSKIKNELKKRVFLRYLPSKIVFHLTRAISEGEKVLKLINEVSSEKEKGPED